MTLKQQCQKNEVVMNKIRELGKVPTDQEFELICVRLNVPVARYKRIYFGQIKLQQ